MKSHDSTKSESMYLRACIEGVRKGMALQRHKFVAVEYIQSLGGSMERCIGNKREFIPSRQIERDIKPCNILVTFMNVCNRKIV